MMLAPVSLSECPLGLHTLVHAYVPLEKNRISNTKVRDTSNALTKFLGGP
jgi:hypothetical protein